MAQPESERTDERRDEQKCMTTRPGYKPSDRRQRSYSALRTPSNSFMGTNRGEISRRLPGSASQKHNGSAGNNSGKQRQRRRKYRIGPGAVVILFFAIIVLGLFAFGCAVQMGWM